MKKKIIWLQFCRSIFSNQSYLVDHNESEHVDKKQLKNLVSKKFLTNNLKIGTLYQRIMLHCYMNQLLCLWREFFYHWSNEVMLGLLISNCEKIIIQEYPSKKMSDTKKLGRHLTLQMNFHSTNKHFLNNSLCTTCNTNFTCKSSLK